MGLNDAPWLESLRRLLLAPNDKVEARSLTLDASDDEISVRFPSSWDPAVGLPAQAGTNAMELEVVITVASFGTKRWELAIDSNDPDEPRRTIEISADVIYPPCRFEVSPERFDLLVLSAQPDRSRAPIEIRVDGQLLAPADPSGHIVWTYDATENAVTFDSMNVPANGQTIEIEYRLAC